MKRLTKNKGTSENRMFWKSVESAAEKVKSWPAWKQKLKVTQYSNSHKR